MKTIAALAKVSAAEIYAPAADADALTAAAQFTGGGERPAVPASVMRRALRAEMAEEMGIPLDEFSP